MLGRSVIYLITETITNNALGDPVPTLIERKVFADQLDIGQTEFYQAANTDLKPSVKFKIRFQEYKNEPSFKYNDKVYNILRTFSPDQEFIELTGGGLQNDS